MLPDDVISIVESQLGSSVTNQEAVGGGCIANAARVDTSTGTYFVKWSRDEVADTFPPEAAGLRALRQADSDLVIPEPMFVQDATGARPGILLMEWIEPGRKSRAFWEEFGRGLADLHRHTAARYGFEVDNYIGRLPQENGWINRWPEFFLTRRLEPQVRMAREGGRWDEEWNVQFDRLVRRIGDILPADPQASLLHGDLWGGNFLVTSEGRAALIDPAVYFGHREADLGMTRLFGGFDAAFYAAYEQAWPLEPGSDERQQIYNLYHLINHLNHFGSGYAAAVGRILKRY